MHMHMCMHMHACKNSHIHIHIRTYLAHTWLGLGLGLCFSLTREGKGLGGAGQALMHWRPKHLARWLTGSSPGLGLPAHVADAVLRLSIDGLALLKLESALLDAFRLASLESNMCGIEISQILAENLRKPPESVAFRYS